MEDNVVCTACAHSFEITEELLESGKAKCPWCGATYQPPKEFDWERFQALCALDPADIPPQVREALLDLRHSVVMLRELVDEPVDMMMQMFGKLQEQSVQLDRWKDTWETLRTNIQLRPVDKDYILKRMDELKEILDEHR